MRKIDIDVVVLKIKIKKIGYTFYNTVPVVANRIHPSSYAVTIDNS